MTVDEAINLREQLEDDILALLDGYRRATGLTPTEVDVTTIDTTSLADSRRALAISKVAVRVAV